VRHTDVTVVVSRLQVSLFTVNWQAFTSINNYAALENSIAKLLGEIFKKFSPLSTAAADAEFCCELMERFKTFFSCDAELSCPLL
jgi:hypothetical protein